MATADGQTTDDEPAGAKCDRRNETPRLKQQKRPIANSLLSEGNFISIQLLTHTHNSTILASLLTKLTSGRDRGLEKTTAESSFLSFYPSIDHHIGPFSSTRVPLSIPQDSHANKGKKTNVTKKTSSCSIAPAHPTLPPVSFRPYTSLKMHIREFVRTITEAACIPKMPTNIKDFHFPSGRRIDPKRMPQVVV